MLQLISAENPKTSIMKVETIWTGIYRQCGIWRPPLGRAILQLYSSEILRRLPPGWAGTAFHAGLQHHSKNSCTPEQAAKYFKDARERGPRAPRGPLTLKEIGAITDHQWLEEAAEMLSLKLRKKKNLGSITRGETGSDVDMSDANISSSVTNHRQQPIISSVEDNTGDQSIDEQGRTPEFKSYVELITSRSKDDQAKLNRANGIKPGRGAGKKSALKPKPLKRPTSDSQDEDENETEAGIARKRSRNGERSSSTDSESSSTATEDEVTAYTQVLEDYPTKLNMAPARNGGIKCTKCYDWTENDPQSAEGRHRALEHQMYHAEKGHTDVVSLVQKEGTLTNHITSNLEQYLMEKSPETKYDTAGFAIPLRIQRGWPH